MINFTKDELSTFSLQQLADLFAEGTEELELQKEMFELRASHSDYGSLTGLDLKTKWQEDTIQKYIDLKREHMVLENPAELSPAEQALLEPGVVTKEAELALQAKLDARNAKRRGKKPEPEATVETPIVEEPKVTAKKK